MILLFDLSLSTNTRVRLIRKIFTVAKLGAKYILEHRQTVYNLESYFDEEGKLRCPLYPKLLHVIARTVHLLGRQGLSFRGYRENINSNINNPGNFFQILKEISNYDINLVN